MHNDRVCRACGMCALQYIVGRNPLQDQKTPLHIALEMFSFDVMHLLVHSKADIEARDEVAM